MPQTATPIHAGLIHVIYAVITATAIALSILALLWGWWAISVYRRDGRRQRDGLCLRCGYDLRQSAGRCPECGEPVYTSRDRVDHQSPAPRVAPGGPDGTGGGGA